MGVFGEVRIEPQTTGFDDVLMRVDSNGLDKPLRQCNSRQIGRYGEDLAEALLLSQDLEILERNWTCPFGEADIVAADGRCVILVEVKTRVVEGAGSDMAPEIAVNYRKRNRYQKLALVYLAEHASERSVRFDVVAVNLTGPCEARLRHLRGAYEWDD